VDVVEVVETTRVRRKSDDDRMPASEAEYQTIEKLVRLVLMKTTIRDLDRPGHGVVDLVRGLRRGALTKKDARLWQLALSRTARALGVDVEKTLRAALRTPATKSEEAR
jgi:hypothetical protein